MNINFKFKRGFKSFAEKKAQYYREIFNLSSTDPLPASLLAEHLDIKVLTPQEIFIQNSTFLSILQNSNEWSAMTLIAKSGRRLLIHNDRHSKPRQESNLMHEIAHAICEHKTCNETIINGLILRNYNLEQEKEAEWLGGCLQLPRTALVWAQKEIASIQGISQYYNASQDMVRFRINITGVKKQLGY